MPSSNSVPLRPWYWYAAPETSFTGFRMICLTLRWSVFAFHTLTKSKTWGYYWLNIYVKAPVGKGTGRSQPRQMKLKFLSSIYPKNIPLLWSEIFHFFVGRVICWISQLYKIIWSFVLFKHFDCRAKTGQLRVTIKIV